MSKKPIPFRKQMKLARPDVVERQKQHSRKSCIALHLRMLRDAEGLTQADIAKATGMSRQSIAEMESLVGPIPDIEDLGRYVDASGGDIKAVISPNYTDLPADESEWSSPK